MFELWFIVYYVWKRMVIYYASDLHLEFYEDEKELLMFFPLSPNDTLVLAGDIGYPYEDSFKRFIGKCCSNYKYVIYTTGNHEYYGSHSMEDIDSMVRNLQTVHNNFYPLLDSSVTLDGITFIGGTLFTYFTESMYRDAKKYMTDYKYYTPEETVKRNKNTTEYLHTNIVNDNKYVVVTHHMPSYTAITDKYKGFKHNYLFANHLDSLIRRDQVIAWICGHTHTSNIVGKIHINPFGYPGENSRLLKSLIL